MEFIKIQEKNIYYFGSFHEFFNNKKIFLHSFSCIVLDTFSIDLDEEFYELSKRNCCHIVFSNTFRIIDKGYDIPREEYGDRIGFNFLDNLGVDNALLYGTKFATEGQTHISNIVIIDLFGITKIEEKIKKIYPQMPNPGSMIGTKVGSSINPQSTTIGIQSFPKNFVNYSLNTTNWIEKFSEFYLKHRKYNKYVTILFNAGIFIGKTKIINYTDGSYDKGKNLWFFNDSKIDDIQISGFIGDMIFESINFNEIEISDLNINNSKNTILFNLKKPYLVEKEIYLKDQRKNKISLHNLKDIYSIHLDGDDFSNIELEIINCDFSKTIFHITGVNIESLKFVNSNFGKAIFNGVKITNLYIEDGTLNECIFNGVEFPEKLEKIPNIKKQKDNYRQLKHVMDKNGNHTEANKFYGLEMEYELEVIKNKKIVNSWKDYFSFSYYVERGDNLSSIIVLTTSKVLNSFGNNWLSALLWLITLAFFSSLIKLYYIDIINEGLLRPNSIKVPLIEDGGLIINVFSTFLFFWLLILFVYVFYKIEAWIIDKAPMFFLILFSVILIRFFDFDLINTFLKMLMNPLHGFNYLYGSDFKSSLSLLGFTTYKILYGIILWHLIVALKRTTKR